MFYYKKLTSSDDKGRPAYEGNTLPPVAYDGFYIIEGISNQTVRLFYQPSTPIEKYSVDNSFFSNTSSNEILGVLNSDNSHKVFFKFRDGVSNIRWLFYGVPMKRIYFINSPRLESINSTFKNCTMLEEINQFNTHFCTDFTSAFEGCTSLINAPRLDYTNADLLNYTFKDCTSLQEAKDVNQQDIWLMNVNQHEKCFKNVNNEKIFGTWR